LHDAVFRGREDLVRLFLENGADVTVVDRRGQTALAKAAQRGYQEIVRLLREQGGGK
jgi:ankyrin repeat protein